MKTLLIGLLAVVSISAFAEEISSNVVESVDNVGRITIQTTTDDRGAECNNKLNEMRKRLKKANKTILTDDDFCLYKGGKDNFGRTILFLL